MAHELRRERENPGMYAAELGEWDAANPRPTFCEFLRSRRAEPWEEAA